ncbi:MAG: SDR family NAD(P)-dependent oxidoreductase [Solirubrobacteraceae bacterium]
MSRVLITGSADGLGLLVAQRLIAEGHHVVLHARSNTRSHDALHAASEASAVLIADLSHLSELHRLAAQANRLGRFDAVIHNAAVGAREPRRMLTRDGLCEVFAVNVIAPYVLTALIEPPSRLIYLSSAMHRGGDPDLSDVNWLARAWDPRQAYADSKLFCAMLGFALARIWPATICNVVEPGWVPTRMGGPAAPEDLRLGADTQAWLAVSDEKAARVTGRYLYHRAQRTTHPAVSQVARQNALLELCAELSGVALAGTAALGTSPPRAVPVGAGA